MFRSSPLLRNLRAASTARYICTSNRQRKSRCGGVRAPPKPNPTTELKKSATRAHRPGPERTHLTACPGAIPPLPPVGTFRFKMIGMPDSSCRPRFNALRAAALSLSAVCALQIVHIAI